MLRYLIVSMAVAAAPAFAQSAGTTSEACREALETVQLQENRALAANQMPGGASTPEGTRASIGLQAARERAARACLGGNPGTPPQRMAQPPVSVPSVNPAPPATSPGVRYVPTPSAASLPQRSDTMLTVTACDPGGCWASDGSRLNRVGPNLVGPHGTCTLQGPVLRCP